MSSTPLISALRSSDRTALAAVLSDDIAFHSPVTDYRGRDEVVNLLATIGTVIEDVRIRRELRHGRETATFVEGVVGGRAIDGVLDQIHDETGRVCEITLMLRPLDALHEGVRRMRTALGLGS
jgi:SnoaL-like protein